MCAVAQQMVSSICSVKIVRPPTSVLYLVVDKRYTDWLGATGLGLSTTYLVVHVIRLEVGIGLNGRLTAALQVAVVSEHAFAPLATVIVVAVYAVRDEAKDRHGGVPGMGRVVERSVAARSVVAAEWV